MKTLLAALLLACHLASAQDVFFHTWFTNWQRDCCGGYACTNRVEVGTNQILFPWTTTPSANNMQVQLYAEYGQGTNAFYATSQYYDPPMGPCTVRVETRGPTNAFVMLWRLVNVNTTPIPGMAVVPSGVAATMRLDTSTNLTSWQTITNASLGPVSGNRFFRLSLSLP